MSTSVPDRLVTLLEILELSAEAWWRLASLTGQMLIRLETSMPSPEVIFPTLAELQRECDKLSLHLASSQLSRIRDEGIVANVPFHILGPKLQRMVYDLNLRIHDELNNRFFLSIPTDFVDFFRQKEPLFGLIVEEKLPNLSEDISEAGKCLALGRSTACVFHLMRVMEMGLQKLGSTIGVDFTSSKNWQNILDEINKKIKTMDPKEHMTKRYSATASHLYHVKLAWRNEVMHPKQTYTEAEGKSLLSAVGAFIRDIADFVS